TVPPTIILPAQTLSTCTAPMLAVPMMRAFSRRAPPNGSVTTAFKTTSPTLTASQCSVHAPPDDGEDMSFPIVGFVLSFFFLSFLVLVSVSWEAQGRFATRTRAQLRPMLHLREKRRRAKAQS